MYETVLLPTDGSETAARAADAAFALADRFDATLHAIHVVDRDDLPAGAESEASAELVTRGEATLSEIADRAAEDGLTATTQLIETSGPIHGEIVDYADDHGADLVVMGTHGRTGLNRLVLGSVAERTLRTAPVPVLTVHDDTRLDPSFEKILVPTDGSEPGVAAASHAVQLAAGTGASLHVVHVVDHTAVSGEFGDGAVLQALQESGQRAVDEVVERAQEGDVRSIEAAVLGGTPSRAILDYADEYDVDLVVLGTHGRSGLKRYLIGSVTEKVVRLAERPVLSVSSLPDTE